MLTRLPVAALILGVAAIIVGCAFTSEAAKVAPTISSVSPSSVVAGSSGFTLTVNGANFQPNAVVLWNGTPRTTTFNSKNQLQAAILSTDVAQPGTVQISVLIPPFKTNVSSQFTFAIPARLQVMTSSLPTATDQKPYGTSLSGSGGISPYSWSIASGRLPPGLTIASSTGVISGTATSTGTYSFTVQVKDSETSPQAASKTLQLGVLAPPSTLVISTSILPNGTVQAAYSATLAASGGTAPYSWSITSGALPTGLSLTASTGVISGIPTQTGGFTFTVQVKDSEPTPQTASNTFSISINNQSLQITTSSLPGGSVSTSYSTSLAASGGTTPYSWSITAGALPGGLSLASSTGVISGTPSASGTFTFTVQVKDSSTTPQTASKQFSIAVAAAPAPLAISTTSLAGGTAGTSYSATLAASGGTTPYSWSITSGVLPNGLTLASSTGKISGTPSASGTFAFTVQVKDSSATPHTATQQLSITVATAPLTITTSSLPAGTVSVAYSATLAASGGVAPYTWGLSSGTLPNGLTLASSTGKISGTPTLAGSFSFGVKVTDSAASSTTATFSITIASPPLAGPCSSTAAPPSGYQHIVIFSFENRTWSNVGLGFSSSTMPYLHSLAAGCTFFSDWTETNTSQSSLTQYIGETSGVNNTATVNDCNPSSTCRSTDNNIFRQVRVSGGTARNYVEGATTGCSASGNAAKHIPDLYYFGTYTDSAGVSHNDHDFCSTEVRPYSEFQTALNTNTLPTYSFITPTLCNDGHDCGDSTVDSWAKTNIQAVLDSPAYQSGSVAVFVWYDEDHPTPNAQIAPTAHAGDITQTGIGTHAALLKTIELLLGLPVMQQGQLITAADLRVITGLAQ